jgi:hypothetical protein
MLNLQGQWAHSLVGTLESCGGSASSALGSLYTGLVCSRCRQALVAKQNALTSQAEVVHPSEPTGCACFPVTVKTLHSVKLCCPLHCHAALHVKGMGG